MSLRDKIAKELDAVYDRTKTINSALNSIEELIAESKKCEGNGIDEWRCEQCGIAGAGGNGKTCPTFGHPLTKIEKCEEKCDCSLKLCGRQGAEKLRVDPCSIHDCPCKCHLKEEYKCKTCGGDAFSCKGCQDTKEGWCACGEPKKEGFEYHSTNECKKIETEDPCDCSSCLHGRESAKKLREETDTVEPKQKFNHCTRCDKYMNIPLDAHVCKPEKPKFYSGWGSEKEDFKIEEPKPECEHDRIKYGASSWTCSKCNTTIERCDPADYYTREETDDLINAIVNRMSRDHVAEEKAFRMQLLDCLFEMQWACTSEGISAMVAEERLEALKSKFL